MANVAQMAVDKFWGSITALEQAAKTEKAALEANRQRLIAASSDARKDPNPARSAKRQAVLAPLIHQNSALRLRYRDLAAKFNAAVNAARAGLQKAGLTAPAALGQIETGLVIGVVAVAALGTAWAIAYAIQESRRNLDKATDLAIRVTSDPSSTSEQLAAAQRILQSAAATAPKGPFGLDLGSLALPLALVAVIMVGPQLLSTFGGRKRKAAA